LKSAFAVNSSVFEAAFVNAVKLGTARALKRTAVIITENTFLLFLVFTAAITAAPKQSMMTIGGVTPVFGLLVPYASAGAAETV